MEKFLLKYDETLVLRAVLVFEVVTDLIVACWFCLTMWSTGDVPIAFYYSGAALSAVQLFIANYTIDVFNKSMFCDDSEMRNILVAAFTLIAIAILFIVMHLDEISYAL